MLFCRHCGGKTPDNALFCTHCGRQLHLLSEEATIASGPHTTPTGYISPPLLSQPVQAVPTNNLEKEVNRYIIPPVAPPELPMTGIAPSVQGTPLVGTVPSIPGGAGMSTATLTVGTMAKLLVIAATCAAVIFAGIKVIPPILHYPIATPITSITPVTKTLPMPPTQTSCPAPGTARAAVIAPLALGMHQNLVYTTNQGEVVYNPNLPPSDTLKRYDVTTGQTTDIVKLVTSVADAQISTDGQWILFATVPSSMQEQAAIQMIRLDGQGLQTLYCNPVKLDPTNSYFGLASISSLAWSNDQKQVIFTEGDNTNNPPSLYLLNLVHGTVQKELQPDPGSSTTYYPHLWIDNTHVALLALDIVNGSGDDSIFVLDTNNGVNQQNNNLQLIAKDSTLFTFNFDISPDHAEFIVGKSSNLSHFSSSISVLPVKGGPEQSIFTSQTLQVIDIRVISNTTLLVYLLDPSATNATNQSGLYKMNIDGTGFTKLIGYDSQIGGGQTDTIDVSRDRSMYALGQLVDCGQHCYYSLIRFGFLSGGNPTTLPDSNHHPSLVGWTMM